MKHKLLLVLLTALIPCLFMQGCISNFEEDNTELSEEDRVAEMFREAGFKVEKLSSKPVNPPMTEKEASLFLAAYKQGMLRFYSNTFRKYRAEARWSFGSES